MLTLVNFFVLKIFLKGEDEYEIAPLLCLGRNDLHGFSAIHWL